MFITEVFGMDMKILLIKAFSFRENICMSMTFIIFPSPNNFNRYLSSPGDMFGTV